MTSVALWIVGAPGVGKTTLARKIMGKVTELVTKPKFTIAENAVAAGHYTGATFDGADTVPYNGANQVIDLWQERYTHAPLFILDGDRFSNVKAKAKLWHRSSKMLCLRLDASADVLAARRAARGSNQNPSWMAGRETKARNFFDTFDPGNRLSVRADDPDMEAAVQSWLKTYLT